MSARVYCTNEGCKGRESCAKAQPMQDRDSAQFFSNGYYADRCRQFELLPMPTLDKDKKCLMS
jgi:hypothetical protein